MATAIGKHVNKLTRGAFSAHGFAYAQILTHWDSIVRPDLADFCQPERLRWPPGQERIKAERRRLGGTLTIKVEGPAAIELQHDSQHIIERINNFYGYSAISGLQIKQGPVAQVEQKPDLPALDDTRRAGLDARLRSVTDPDLKQALKRLGTGALATSNRPAKDIKNN